MNISEIKTLIRGSTKKNETLPLADLSVLKSIANVTLEIDRESNDYYYKVEVKDLVDKDFDFTIISNNGWELSLDEQYMLLFL